MRWITLPLLLWIALTTDVPTMAQDLAPPPAPRFRVYVGTYTGGPSDSKGIYQFELETATGLLIPKGLAAETPSPRSWRFIPRASTFTRPMRWASSRAN